MSKSAAKAAGSSSPVAAASPVKSVPVSSADSSAVDHSTTDKSVNSVSTADTAPAAGALDNGSVVCQTTN